MTDAPERIWLDWRPGLAVTSGPLAQKPRTEYIRADTVAAMVAEARNAALEAELAETQDRANAFATKEYHTERRAERVAGIVERKNTIPILASPFEHIARPDPSGGKGCRNFDRWHQWRADIEND